MIFGRKELPVGVVIGGALLDRLPVENPPVLDISWVGEVLIRVRFWFLLS